LGSTVSRRTLSRWLHEGIGPPSIKLPSGARRYRKADLDRWIAEHQADE
jgi:DNA-binding transcriptional MerR regulator